jgi:hypothetical protein
VPPALAAFDKPRGKRVGEIRLESPKCLTEPASTEGSESCSYPLRYVFAREGSANATNVEVAEWSYETLGLVSYRPSIPQGRTLWSALETDQGVVWVQTDAGDVHPFERVAYLVQDFSVLCEGPGLKCSPPAAGMGAEMARLAAETTCYDNPYSVVGVIETQGRRYYRLELENLEGRPTSLPHPIYVPTRNASGQHTGDFYSRGC